MDRDFRHVFAARAAVEKAELHELVPGTLREHVAVVPVVGVAAGCLGGRVSGGWMDGRGWGGGIPVPMLAVVGVRRATRARVMVVRCMVKCL